MADDQLNARIVYWGPAGSGKSANLKLIHQKLRSDHRGDLRELPTGIDPSVYYEILPIELGQVSGTETRLQVIAVPGDEDQAPTRKQLLEGVAGVVLVLDSRSEKVPENLASVVELRDALAGYGRSLEELPCVIQYNKRDISDPFGMEELHRQLALNAPVFEAVAHEGSGVLQTLTMISKQVVRSAQEAGTTRSAAAPDQVDTGNDLPLDEALLEEKEASDLRIVDAEEAQVHDGRRLSMALTLEDGTGQRHRMTLSVDLSRELGELEP